MAPGQARSSGRRSSYSDLSNAPQTGPAACRRSLLDQRSHRDVRPVDAEEVEDDRPGVLELHERRGVLLLHGLDPEDRAELGRVGVSLEQGNVQCAPAWAKLGFVTVEMSSTSVLTIFWPAIESSRNWLGFLTYCALIPGGSG